MYTLKGLAAHIIMNLLQICPLQNKVVFCSFVGKTYGDNPQVVYEEFLNRKLPLKYIWLMRDKSVQITGAKVVAFQSLLALYHLSTAKVWIDCSGKQIWIVKRKNQLYVQTWHANIALKKIQKDAAGLTLSYEESLEHDVSITDLMVSGSKWQTENYRSAFGYTGEVLEVGQPKSDVLYGSHEEYKKKVKNFFSLSPQTKILLYVPTFRDGGDDSECFDIDLNKAICECEKRWNGEWICLARLHPIIKKKQNTIPYSDKIINATEYPLTDELIVASDLVVTDYSSCMFSGLEAKKKVVLYATDIDKYSEERGLYFDINSLPFPVATNNSELTELIHNFDESGYQSKCKRFVKRTGIIETDRATKLVVDEILKRAFS